jgi:hypothetical protein
MPTPPTFTSTTLASASLNAIGLWRTATVTLTGQTTTAINNAFSADYSNYLFVYNVRTNSGSGSMQIQLALNGTPNATAGSYITGGRFVGYPAVGAADFNAATTNWGGSFFSTFPNNGSITISNPFDALATAITGTYSSNNAAVWYGGYHNQTTSYNGLYITNSTAAAMFGQFTVYGMRQ